MPIQIRGGDALNYRGDTLLLFHPSNVKPLTGTLGLIDWRCNAAISRLWKKRPDLFRFGQLSVLVTQGKVPTPTVVMTGLGEGEEMDRDMRREAYRLAMEAAVGIGGKKVAVEGIPVGGIYDSDVLEDLTRVAGPFEKNGRLQISLFSADKDFVRSLMNGNDADPPRE